MSTLPVLSDFERDRRWKSIRKLMEERGLDCLLVWGDSGHYEGHMANVRFISQVGGHGEEAFVLFPLDGQPQIRVVYSGGEWDNISWIKDNHPLTREVNAQINALIRGIRTIRLNNKRIGIAGYEASLNRALMTPYTEEIPYVILSKLKEEFPDVTFENADNLIRQVRQPKSHEEIIMMKQAARIADYGSQAMYRTAKAGIRENEVYANVIREFLANGAENSIQFWWTMGKPNLTRISVTQGKVMHYGDYVICEFTPMYKGYRQHAHRTIHIGNPSKEFADLYSAAKQAHDSCLNYLRPGVTTKELYDLGIGIINEAGYSWNIPLFHGMGLTWEAPFGCPTVTEVPDESNRRLTEGYTIAFQQGAVSKDKKLGCILGDVVAVTENGCERLSNSPLDLDSICV